MWTKLAFIYFLYIYKYEIFQIRCTTYIWQTKINHTPQNIVSRAQNLWKLKVEKEKNIWYSGESFSFDEYRQFLIWIELLDDFMTFILKISMYVA